MATIKKLEVNVNNNTLVISADPTVQDDYIYKFTKLHIDTSSTFNCKRDPSTLANEVSLKSGYNVPLTDYPISLDNILCTDPANELIFIWLQEDKYKNLANSEGFVINSALTGYTTLYLKTEDNICYRIKYSEDGLDLGSLEEVGEDVYAEEDGLEHLIDNIEAYINEDWYIKIDENTFYYLDVENEVVAEYSEEEYAEVVYKLIDFEYFFGITLSVSTLYNNILNSIVIKNSENCEADCSEVNKMLAWQGFSFAKALGRYDQMIYYWKILHNISNSVSTPCNCR